MTLSVVLARVYGIRAVYTVSEFGPARRVGTIRAVVVLLIGLVMLGVSLASVWLFS